MKVWVAITAGFLATACNEQAGTLQVTKPPPQPLMSGSEFLQADTKALQDDDFANPGFLWVDQGAGLFKAASGQSKACSACHSDEERPLSTAAGRYPAIDEQSGELVNLEGRINLCRTRHQGLQPLDYESDELLSLTAYVASLARGTPVSVDTSGGAASWYDRGEAYFYTRRGQYNLACTQCHDDNWGKQLRGDTISQGHGTGFPAYRLEWQTLGSLHRRLSDCDAGVRAEPYPLGSDEYLAVELYLAKRAEGLTVEAPGVRR